MIKTYEEVAMNVIREDWEFRKSQNNASFNQERIARMMGISRSQFAKALGENKNPTISFICRYVIAVGCPIDELLHTDIRCGILCQVMSLHTLAVDGTTVILHYSLAADRHCMGVTMRTSRPR